jgi:NAD(P)-dependent dehydrogenase (short-subunit alcohol dehydrogenase family)
MSSRFAIVTGAGSGIGKATAQVLAERGYDVGLTYGKNVDGVEQTAGAVRAQGQRAFVAQMQLEAPDSVGRAIDQLSNELGGLDALVNNAGLLDFQSFLDLSLDRWRRVIDCNLTGTFLAGQAAAHEWYYVIEGTGVVQIEEEARRVVPGDLVYISPNARHTIYPTGKGKIRALCFASSYQAIGGVFYTPVELKDVAPTEI